MCVTTTDDTRLVEDGIPVASLPAKFCMLDIELYNGIGCPKIHLRLYSTWIDDAHLVAFFPIVDIDVSRRELEVTRQMPNKSISSFVSRWRAKVVGMIYWSPKEQTSMQPRPPHPRTTIPLPPRPYAQRPARQFTPLGMTLTRAFEKLRDAGMICSFGTTPLVASYSSSFPLT
ncbi:hypothetical protein CK203_028282 [Vitis vinifera]|uniref:Uncharacterized protein n=1 Tax=Vitis vinifera TaxID=29760 RepID=A0A438IZY5_VITVI|nr:hypothetical protein CK203_028282 [Vitis vinifera]